MAKETVGRAGAADINDPDYRYSRFKTGPGNNGIDTGKDSGY